MRRKWLSWLLVLALVFSTGCAELSWPTSLTPAQARLQSFVEDVNERLVFQGEKPINRLFELYSGFATLAVTSHDDADVPEDVELSVTMDEETLCVLTLRCSDMTRFVPLAAACIAAVCPSMTWKEASAEPQRYADRIGKAPQDSFADVISTLKGTSVQTYYAYAPNQFSDGVDWTTMTLIFPLEGYEDRGVYVTLTPAPNIGPGSDDNIEYEGYAINDGLMHFEIITTETPSPEDGIIRD